MPNVTSGAAGAPNSFLTLAPSVPACQAFAAAPQRFASIASDRYASRRSGSLRSVSAAASGGGGVAVAVVVPVGVAIAVGVAETAGAGAGVPVGEASAGASGVSLVVGAGEGSAWW